MINSRRAILLIEWVLCAYSPENADEHWIATKNSLFSGATYIGGQILKGCNRIWLIWESWERIDERMRLKVLLTVASNGGVTPSTSHP